MPSGMTSEHMFPLLESEDDMGAFARFASFLARGDIPPFALEGIRRGRMSALRKANGRVRGIVVGDVLRRLVARTIAQQNGVAVERATSPYSSMHWRPGQGASVSPTQVWPTRRAVTSCCRSSALSQRAPPHSCGRTTSGPHPPHPPEREG